MPVRLVDNEPAQQPHKPTCFLGIDPGVNGGLACVSEYGVTATKMLDEPGVWEWVRERAPGEGLRVFACVELVSGWVGKHNRKDGDDGSQSNPGSSMFTFGQSYGSLRMALVAAGIPFEAVRPQVWQKALGLHRDGEDATRWKNKLKARAQELFPVLKVTKATADALLLAAYCRMKWGGKACPG